MRAGRRSSPFFFLIRRRRGPAELGTDGQTVGVRVPMEFRIRGGRKEIILPAAAEAEPKAQPNGPLVLALARAHRWQQMIDSGEVPGAEAIAAQHGVDRAYVNRMFRLTSLAPDIVEAILLGDEPDGLSLWKLQKDLPACWQEQRAKWSAKILRCS